MKNYLNRVFIYLKQELPNAYRESITVDNDVFVITVPDDIGFNDLFSELHESIVASIERVRKRDYDLNFTIKSTRQLRDFTILR
ncbi:MAG: hypothetical protein V4520_02520 [Bacteroidota bacterium]